MKRTTLITLKIEGGIKMTDLFDFFFEHEDGFASYKKKENNDVIAEQSITEFKIRGKRFRIKITEIKDKKNGIKKIDWCLT